MVYDRHVELDFTPRELSVRNKKCPRLEVLEVGVQQNAAIYFDSVFNAVGD